MKSGSKKKGVIILVIVVFVLALLYNGAFFKKEEVKEEAKKIKQVETVLLNKVENGDSGIAIAGKVVPEKKVDVVSLTQGTAMSTPFNVGDEIALNQVLVYLDSNLIKTSHLNSQTNYTNMINNLESVKMTTSESVRQAEVNVSNAEQSVNSAMIALEASEDNLKNTITLQNKTNIDAHDQAVISFYEFLNSIENALYKVNYIIAAEEGPQLDGISPTLSARSYQTLNDAKKSYVVARESYDALKGKELTIHNVKKEFVNLNNTLALAKGVVDDTIDVLNNTVASDTFSETSLTTQKTAFVTLRSAIVASQVSAASTLSGLENLSISDSSSIESLGNAVDSAKKNVDLAKGSYNNAVIALNSARQAKNQQILIAQASVDSALGQLNLSSNQIADLTIKAPIQGKITKKLIEVGSEVRSGQKIAEVSQIDMLKIEINLASDDVSKIKLGQEVKINDSLVGTISSIEPSADEITKKVKVEILFDNKDNELISGTFVDVHIEATEAGISGEDSSIMLIPLKALNISQTGKYVFVADCVEDRCFAKKTLVTVGETTGRMIEIIEGLNKEDELLVAGSKTVSDGERIVIKK